MVATTRGLKWTETVQDAPPASGPPHGFVPLPVTVKLPLAAMPEIFTEEVPAFVTVSFRSPLVVPATTPLKEKLAGEKVNGCGVAALAPVPVSEVTWGLGSAPCVRVSAPFTAPLVVGLKVTAMVQFAFAARVVPQGVLPLPLAK